MRIKIKDTYLKNSFFIVFFLSGFAGLIYESIWTHYLKLFLGHAAYAQALVLFIFMGGMAVGSWTAARYGDRIRNLLVAYAVVEGIVGILAIIFHNVFVASTNFVYMNLFSAVDAVWAADLFRWTLAALLVLPQSILLGTTFPLMSGGIIRTYPENPGKTLALLYFCNSLGAAIGVLISGFYMIDSFGLPGTLFIAGVINLSIALVVWLLSHEDERHAVIARLRGVTGSEGRLTRGLVIGMLLCSAVTGTASFIYEIGWIRMLSMVLGGSNHGFELMLSAFILGLSIGGFWIRRRIDSLDNPILTLGKIQLIMGTMAMLTLPLYNNSFEFMGYILKSLSRNEQGYILFNLASHSIALVVMLPATICAGMTLPIITYILYSRGYGESSIGKVYAFNTLGGLLGIAFSVLLLMPVLGLKNLIILGASLDLLLGLCLLTYARQALSRILRLATVTVILCVLMASMFLVRLDPIKMISGVYRMGKIFHDLEVIFYQDGKTATISLSKLRNKLIISTNGKPDAAISIDENPGPDEWTMMLLAALPMSIHPKASRVAIIGMGSGLTSHVVLANSQIKHLDTIEIEKAMVSAAVGFGSRVNRVFDDPRSSIQIEDAKAFFSTRKGIYDIIISEPSNPWVSGVAGLFSSEFYHQAKRYIADDGLFVQWIHLYEIDINLVASVIKALSGEFSDYSLYMPNAVDLIIVAKKSGSVPMPDSRIFQSAGLIKELDRIGVVNLTNLKMRYLGSKKTLDDLFKSYPLPANSDYFPVLDNGAVKARFMSKNAFQLQRIRTVALPVLEVMEGDRVEFAEQPGENDLHLPSSQMYKIAASLLNYFKQQNTQQRGPAQTLSGDRAIREFRLFNTIQNQCNEEELHAGWLPSLHWVAKAILPYFSRGELLPFWTYLESSGCYSKLPPDVLDWIMLYKAVGNRDFAELRRLSEQKLSLQKTTFSTENDYLLSAVLLSSISLNDTERDIILMKKYKNNVKANIVLRLLASRIFSMNNHTVSELAPRPD